MPITIPYTCNLLPAPPASQSASQIAHWNRGVSAPRELEALRVMAIIRPLLPYATFMPRDGRGGWDARPPGFKGSNDLGWGYANTLDILDDLVADLALFQPSMSQCAAIDPASGVPVATDVTRHLPGFHRSAQLLLQYALTVARSASLDAVRSYNPAAFPLYTSPAAAPPPQSISGLQGPWTTPVSHHAYQCSAATLSPEMLLAIGRALTADALARISTAAQVAAIDNTPPTLTPSQTAEITAIGNSSSTAGRSSAMLSRSVGEGV